MRSSIIKDVASFISEFQNEKGQLLFRGEAKDYGETALLPTYGRLLLKKKRVPEKFKKVTNEQPISLNVCSDGMRLSKDISAEQSIHSDYWEKLAEVRGMRMPPTIWEAQHEGLPTRLLDWSGNPLIGLYFAAVKSEDNGFVYVVDVESEILDHTQIREPYHSHGPFGREALDSRIEFVRPPRMGLKIQRQTGFFSVHRAPWVQLTHNFGKGYIENQAGNKIFNATPGTQRRRPHDVRKYEIRAKDKIMIIDQLKIFGISENNLGLSDEKNIQDQVIRSHFDS